MGGSAEGGGGEVLLGEVGEAGLDESGDVGHEDSDKAIRESLCLITCAVTVLLFLWVLCLVGFCFCIVCVGFVCVCVLSESGRMGCGKK